MWKDEFEKIKPVADVDIRDGQWLIEQDEARDFISTEIIEKLIEEIPNETGNWDELNTMTSNAYLKQQLKDKWL